MWTGVKVNRGTGDTGSFEGIPILFYYNAPLVCCRTNNNNNYTCERRPSSSQLILNVKMFYRL